MKDFMILACVTAAWLITYAPAARASVIVAPTDNITACTRDGQPVSCGAQTQNTYSASGFGTDGGIALSSYSTSFDPFNGSLQSSYALLTFDLLGSTAG